MPVHGRGGHVLPPSLRKTQVSPDCHFESLVSHATTLLTPTELNSPDPPNSKKEKQKTPKHVRVSGSPSDISRSLNNWLEIQAGPGWQGQVSVTCQNHPTAASGAKSTRVEIEMKIKTPGNDTFSVVLGEGILKAALWLTRANFGGTEGESFEADDGDKKYINGNCEQFENSTNYVVKNPVSLPMDNTGLFNSLKQYESGSSDRAEHAQHVSRLEDRQKARVGSRKIKVKIPRFSTKMIGLGKRIRDPCSEFSDSPNSKKFKPLSRISRRGRGRGGGLFVKRVSYKEINDGKVTPQFNASREKTLFVDKSKILGFLEGDVLGETDPLVVPVLCGDSPLQGFLRPFCGRRDAVILHKGKSLTGYEFERISGKAYNKKWKQSVKVAPGVGVVCGKGDVGAWLQAAGALLGHAAVGRRLAVYWEDEHTFYAGRIKAFLEHSGEHQVVYDDGEFERLQLVLQKVKWLAEPGSTPTVIAGSSKRPPGVEDSDKQCGKCDACVASSWLPNCPSIPCYETVAATAADQGHGGAQLAIKKYALIGKYISVKLPSLHGPTKAVTRRGQVLAFHPKQFTHKLEFDDRHEEYIQLW
eukprot:CAMPEP_0196590398 /NCGR_PEP_ID=MMETSP1081-20130531/66525_1 /TAXON_ID=36882 /ORGANISM="Pyramimonas amylifera, Strain CCMP720" /LENGTH=584 /DNA_ID=CAMNT_0041913495 /DNA_START=99 /DNA_END=1850 /DNA_ORIENTATION=+